MLQLFFPIYWLAYNQMSNNFVSQAGQMERYVFRSNEDDENSLILGENAGTISRTISWSTSTPSASSSSSQSATNISSLGYNGMVSKATSTRSR